MAERERIVKELGLPPDCRIYWVKRIVYPKVKSTKLCLFEGTSIVIDDETEELVCAVRFNPYKQMHPDLFAKFEDFISIVGKHAEAWNGQQGTNGSMKCEEAHGDMFLEGWHAGYNNGIGCPRCSQTVKSKLISVNHGPRSTQTSLSENTSDSLVQVIFAGGVCFHAFESNSIKGRQNNVPCFSNPKWKDTPNSLVWASSLSVTQDEFQNKAHKDQDFSSFAFGFFSHVICSSWKIYKKADNPALDNVQGATFMIDDYNTEIFFDECDGVVEIIWQADINHHSTESTTHTPEGTRIDAKVASVTHFGCSAQISKKLVNKINAIELIKRNMNLEEWQHCGICR
ncbi:hypothetical protein CROQUDRAFT_55001 [Cronartium quercuum f. sp. fusiforme G11]|uniref:Tet-like 2OG-Fe(II) oxygenase domain-containing protein n=1 Tax=Cronartium quercuum f. sp. fusiforme G11 TaxID=708437 RepID=A0A9P6N530_9BASI|nr:hypothetical protein CROQUDRAFT_55001 [Cronartium quercuum f. sp. fusiforme G11]